MKSKNEVKQIALERLWRLAELAEEEFPKHSERSKRYIDLMLKISTKNRVRVPSELKKKFCKKCHAFLKPGKNAKLRVTKDYFNLTCLECGFSRKLKIK